MLGLCLFISHHAGPPWLTYPLRRVWRGSPLKGPAAVSAVHAIVTCAQPTIQNTPLFFTSGVWGFSIIPQVACFCCAHCCPSSLCPQGPNALTVAIGIRLESSLASSPGPRGSLADHFSLQVPKTLIHSDLISNSLVIGRVWKLSAYQDLYLWSTSLLETTLYFTSSYLCFAHLKTYHVYFCLNPCIVLAKKWQNNGYILALNNSKIHVDYFLHPWPFSLFLWIFKSWITMKSNELFSLTEALVCFGKGHYLW